VKPVGDFGQDGSTGRAKDVIAQTQA